MCVPTRAELDALIRREVGGRLSREWLLADPRAAVSSLIGFDIHGFGTITIHEESFTDVHLVIPAAADDEVSG